MKNSFLLLFWILGLCACHPQKPTDITSADDPFTLFIGTYTQKEGHVDGKGKGIGVYEMNRKTGELTHVATSDPVVSPSYVAVHPRKKWVYAVNEYDGGKEEFASISAFRFDTKTKALTLINRVNSLGQYPCHLSIDTSGRFVMAANYVGGSVALFPVKKDGSLEEATAYKKHEETVAGHPRQEAPHAHMIVQHSVSGFVYAVDLGANHVYQYALDRDMLNYTGKTSMEPGAGPRHLAFHPTKPRLYVINELNGKIEAFDMDEENGSLSRFQITGTMAAGKDNTPAGGAIKIHPSGKFLYATNRGEVNEIACFSMDEQGKLTLIGHQPTFGQVPRDLEIDPSGTFLLVANQDSDEVVTFRIDPDTGRLTEPRRNPGIPTPVCLTFLE